MIGSGENLWGKIVFGKALGVVILKNEHKRMSFAKNKGIFTGAQMITKYK